MKGNNRNAKRTLSRFQTGAGMTEYIIIVCLIAIAVLLSVRVFGDQIRALWGMVTVVLNGKAEETHVDPLTDDSDSKKYTQEEIEEAKKKYIEAQNNLLVYQLLYANLNVQWTDAFVERDCGAIISLGSAICDKLVPGTGNYFTMAMETYMGRPLEAFVEMAGEELAKRATGIPIISEVLAVYKFTEANDRMRAAKAVMEKLKPLLYEAIQDFNVASLRYWTRVGEPRKHNEVVPEWY